MTELMSLASLSKPLDVDQLTTEPEMVHLEVSRDDRAVLAEQLNVLSLDAFSGKLSATKHGDLVRVDGALEAQLGRTCVVSLEPMQETIDETFTAEFTTILPESPAADEIEADLDAPEPLKGSTINLGDVLFEQLVLAMNPHPRKEGAVAPQDPGAGQESSPFDVLKALKN
ncbi:MAG: DUF177 domain-containing protein [Pseudomonadota bacterium]